VAPVEFTMRLEDYAALGGHLDQVRPLTSLDRGTDRREVTPHADNPWPMAPVRGSGD
jgi:hypothetical protein